MGTFKYRKIANLLQAEIIASGAQPGSRIPTEDDLVRRFAMRRNTIRQAVSELVKQGFLVRVQGSGTFLADRVAEYREKKRATNGTRRIGIVLNQVNSYIFPSVLTGINNTLLERDCHMVIRMTMNHVSIERRVLEEILAGELSGVLIEPARCSLPQANDDLYRLIEKKIPCVLIHGSLPGFTFPSVNHDNARAYALLVDHLVEKGHRRIAALMKMDEQTGVERYEGYVRTLIRHGITVDEQRILWYTDEDFPDLFSEQNTYRVLKTIKNCTAVACFNDDLAVHLLSFLEQHGMSVPRDISVVGYDNLWQSQRYRPVTTINHAKEEFGRISAMAILTLLDNPFADVSYRVTPEFLDPGSGADGTGAGEERL
ncbi:MAG: GntR family transcriptional regulator [Planctomycetes bacterium]|nr:GntR family transcriptional regulator [Planctomycetota bacterium]